MRVCPMPRVTMGRMGGLGSIECQEANALTEYVCYDTLNVRSLLRLSPVPPTFNPVIVNEEILQTILTDY